MDLDPTTPLAKPCTRCGETKVLDEFYRAKTGRWGRHAWCRECMKAYSAERARLDPERQRQYARDYYRRHRLHALERQAAYDQQEQVRRRREIRREERELYPDD